MSEHILFLTGRLAEKQLRNILEKMQGEWQNFHTELEVLMAQLYLSNESSECSFN